MVLMARFCCNSSLKNICLPNLFLVTHPKLLKTYYTFQFIYLFDVFNGLGYIETTVDVK